MRPIVPVKLTAEIEQAVAESGARLRFLYPWWLRPFLMRHVAAITLGRSIYVSSSVVEQHLERLLRHEIQHVRQINKIGLMRFYIRYGLEYMRNIRAGMTAHDAYRNISFEREAYAAEEECGCADV